MPTSHPRVHPTRQRIFLGTVLIATHSVAHVRESSANTATYMTSTPFRSAYNRQLALWALRAFSPGLARYQFFCHLKNADTNSHALSPK